jgi:preprotein translocase subunit SecG
MPPEIVPIETLLWFVTKVTPPWCYIMICLGLVSVRLKQNERAHINKALLAGSYRFLFLKKGFKHFLVIVTFFANVLNF